MIATKELQTLRVLKKVIRKGEKARLDLKVDTTQEFEDSSVYNLPKVSK